MASWRHLFAQWFPIFLCFPALHLSRQICRYFRGIVRTRSCSVFVMCIGMSFHVLYNYIQLSLIVQMYMEHTMEHLHLWVFCIYSIYLLFVDLFQTRPSPLARRGWCFGWCCLAFQWLPLGEPRFGETVRNVVKISSDIHVYPILIYLNVFSCLIEYWKPLNWMHLMMWNLKLRIIMSSLFQWWNFTFSSCRIMSILRMQLNFKEIKKLNVLNMSPKIPDGSKLKLIRSNQPRSRILRPPVTTYEVQGPSATCQKSWHRFEAPRNT